MFKDWAEKFSIKAFRLITIIWGAQMIYAAGMIVFSVFRTGEFLYLDTFIVEINETFRKSVVAILLTRTVGNIFEFNNGGIFGESIRDNEEDDFYDVDNLQ